VATINHGMLTGLSLARRCVLCACLCECLYVRGHSKW